MQFLLSCSFSFSIGDARSLESSIILTHLINKKYLLLIHNVLHNQAMPTDITMRPSKMKEILECHCIWTMPRGDVVVVVSFVGHPLHVCNSLYRLVFHSA